MISARITCPPGALPTAVPSPGVPGRKSSHPPPGNAPHSNCSALLRSLRITKTIVNPCAARYKGKVGSNIPYCHTEDCDMVESKGGLMHGDRKIPDQNAGDPGRPGSAATARGTGAQQSADKEASGMEDLADAVRAWQRLRETGGRR